MSARRYFLIERPKLGLEFSYEFEKDERRGPYVNTEFRTMTYSEGLDIETKGWVYHPALAVYRLRLSPEWEQMSEQSDGGGENKTRAFLQRYFTEFTFLQSKPYTLRIFANRYMSTLKSSFAKSSKTESDIYGAGLMLKYNVLPTILDYSHLESTRTGFYTSDMGRDQFLLSMKNKSLGDTRLKASYKDSTRTTRSIPISTIQQKASLQNSYNLTEDKRVTLSSSLGYRKTQGDFTERTQYNVYENLLWRHRKNLTTNYTFSYDITDFEAGSSESKALRFNLKHLLYENLTTSIDADGISSQFTGRRNLAYGAGLNFDYRRKIPWGMLNIHMGHKYRINERDITANFIQVIDESRILQTGEVTLLDNEHVDLESITVTDDTGTVVYTKDIDYRVTEIDSFVRIRRTTFGAIADGQEVLVSYRYLSNPAYDFSTFGQSYGINLSLWSTLRLYYRFNRLKEEFLSGIPPAKLKEVRTDIRGAVFSYGWKWTRTELIYEDKESTHTPTIKISAQETITIRPSRRLFFNLSGSFGRIKFKDSGETERSYALNSNLQLIATRWSRLEIEGFWDKVLGKSERTVNTGFSSVFEGFYRIWKASLSYRFSNEEDEISQETYKNHYVIFKVKRTLF